MKTPTANCWDWPRLRSATRATRPAGRRSTPGDGRECDGRRALAPGAFNRSILLTEGVPMSLSVRRFDNDGTPRVNLRKIILRAFRPIGDADGGD